MTRHALILAAGLAMPLTLIAQDTRTHEQVLEEASEEYAWIGDPHAFEQPGIEQPGIEQTTEQPTIEVVFVLDTTGSMGGLIEGAKQKIWSIANAMVTGEPRPKVRMGLVAYRDRGDAYVTELTALTDDLDAVYEQLMGFSAEGGGDTPESVNQALHEAVSAFDWSWDDDTLRLVYLVGDAPPHTDYEQDVPHAQTCELAATQGIIINAIQCGSMAQTTPIWQEIARSAEGEFFQIEQSGGVQAIATPFDAELADLGASLSNTWYRYGSADEIAEGDARRARAGRLNDLAAEEAAADRAVYMAKAAPVGRDLIDDVISGEVSLADLEADELPEVMRDMTLDQRETYVAEQAAMRAETRQKIQSLSEQRSAYIQEELRRLGGGADAFDAKVLESLKRQAERIGLRYEGE